MAAAKRKMKTSPDRRSAEVHRQGQERGQAQGQPRARRDDAGHHGRAAEDVGTVDRRLRHLPLRLCERPRGRHLPDGLLAALGRARRLLGPGIENDKLMAKLGKHKRGKGCLYINKLDDVDRGVLRKLIEYSVAELRKRRPSRSRSTPAYSKRLTRGSAIMGPSPTKNIPGGTRAHQNSIGFRYRGIVDGRRRARAAPAQQPAAPQPYRVGTPLSQTNEAGQHENDVEQRQGLRQLSLRRELHVRSGP